MASIFIPEQEGTATIYCVNEDLAYQRVNEMSIHIEDQHDSGSSEPSITVSRGIEKAPTSDGFELLVSIQISSFSHVSSCKKYKIELLIKKIVTNIDNHKFSISVISKL